MSRATNVLCQFCRRPMAMARRLLEDAAELGLGATCWICMYATDVGEDERVRSSPLVFRRVHAGEIAEAYEARAVQRITNA